MGDPKKQRAKYSTPDHPWQKERIVGEIELIKGYGFKNKTEIWKMNSLLRKFSSQAKNLVASKNEQSEKEKVSLLQKLKRLSLLSENADIDDVLSLSLRDLLERRLQSIVFRKGLAKSMRQARQFITHRHISVNGKKVTSPSYLISKDEESFVSFSPTSGLVDDMHPERIQKNELPKKPKKDESEVKEKKPAKKASVKKAEKPAKSEKKPAKKAEKSAEKVEVKNGKKA